MLADSGAEAIGLTRFLDKEDFDVSQMAVQISSLLQRCVFLFEQRGCLQNNCYTAIMCNYLSKPMTIFSALLAACTLQKHWADGILSQMRYWIGAFAICELDKIDQIGLE